MASPFSGSIYIRRAGLKFVSDGVVHSTNGCAAPKPVACQRSWRKGTSKVWHFHGGAVTRAAALVTSMRHPSSLRPASRAPARLHPSGLLKSFDRKPGMAVFLNEKCQPQPRRPWFQKGKGQPSWWAMLEIGRAHV